MFMMGFCLITFAQTTYSASRPSNEEYYIDRVREEKKMNTNVKKPPIAAGIVRFGYAFNYDAFTYGLSLYYQWNEVFGATMGFDGYYIPSKLIYNTLTDEFYPSMSFSMPLWDLRAGFGISRYVLFGAVLGKLNINDADNHLYMRKDAWFINNKESQFMYGGFVTLLLPVSKYFGFNFDFAVTNKTGFNVGAGFNVTFPLK